MQTIDDAAPATAPPPGPRVGIRVVATLDGTTRRADLALHGSSGVVVEDGVARPFETERVWPVVRDLLPPLDHVRADPPPQRTAPGRPAGPELAETARAVVVVATVVGEGEQAETVGVRTWLATDDELWAVTARDDGSTEVRAAAPGSVAELLVWDVTGALEVLVRALGAAS